MSSVRMRLSVTDFFCENCRTKESIMMQEKMNSLFSEAKEEETDCQYCLQRNIRRDAETLLEGIPACRDCRKSKNVVNYVTGTSSSKMVVTQVTSKENEDEYITWGEAVSKDPRARTSVDFANKSMSIDLKSPKGNFKMFPQTSPTNESLDIQTSSFLTNKVLEDPKGQHVRGASMGNYLNPNLRSLDIQKTQPRVADPKVIEIFHKIQQKGIESRKSQLVYSSSSDKYSGKKFHEKCDKKNPLIIVVTLISGYIFGGFFYKALDPKTIEFEDKLSGLYSTTDGKTIDFYAVNQHKIIYHPSGIAFGSPTMLQINFDSLSTSVCNFELGFYDPFGRKIPFKFEKGSVDWSTIITDISVFKLK